MRVSIGSDHRAVQLKAKISQLLGQLGHEVLDEGTNSDQQAVDYPDIASAVSRKVSRGEVDRGLLMCGSGIGMAITANKFAGVRATTCHDEVTAELCRRHNDVNVLCLSSNMLGERKLDRMIEIWLSTPFDGGRHARRLEKIASVERTGEPGSGEGCE